MNKKKNKIPTRVCSKAIFFGERRIMMCFGYCCSIAQVLAALGAINWGTVAFFKFNFVDYLDAMFGRIGLDMILYGLIGLSGIYVLFCLCFSCKLCKK